jgi:hypothetical protein
MNIDLRIPGRGDADTLHTSLARHAKTIAAAMALWAIGLATDGLGPAGLSAQNLPRPSVVEGVDLGWEKGARRPAWVVGDVPDSVWILMEAAAESADEAAMKALLRRAEDQARAALVGQEDNVGRRFALAAALGMRADREGGRTRIRAASEMHDELLVVLELDPGHAQARYLLGRLHAGVRRMNGVTRWLATNLLGGGTLKQATWELAEENLAYAERVMPQVPDHHLQLARLYDDTGRPERARAEIDHVLALDATSPMEQAARVEALAFRAELDRRDGAG